MKTHILAAAALLAACGIPGAMAAPAPAEPGKMVYAPSVTGGKHALPFVGAKPGRASRGLYPRRRPQCPRDLSRRGGRGGGEAPARHPRCEQSLGRDPGRPGPAPS